MDNIIQYDKAKITSVGFRKHILKNKRYHIYVFDDWLIMGEEQNQQNPKYRIPLSLTVKIGWCLDQLGKIVAFEFPYKQASKKMYGETRFMEQLKKSLSRKVTFDRISDFYDAKSIIGKGSSAKVLLCKRYEDNLMYAVKSIEKEYLRSEAEGFIGFQQEVSIMNHISQIESSNNFIKLYEIFEGESIYYLVMELMEGRTLREEIELFNVQFNPMINTIRLIMKQILSGLASLHSNDVIHRDLKPENLIFQRKNDFSTLKIVDFGLATFKSAEVFLFPKCGTPGFVAPEILNLRSKTQKYSEVCDVFSAGVILYRLLTGKSLFNGNHLNDILKLNRMCKINFSSEECQNLSSLEKNLLELMLQKDPFNRISASHALKHPFFYDVHGSPNYSIDVSFQNNISGDTKYSPIRPRKPLIENDFDPSMEESSARHQIMVRQIPQLSKPQEKILDSNQPSLKIHDFHKLQQTDQSDLISEKIIPHSPNKLSQRYSRSPKNQSQKFNSFYMKDPLSAMKKTQLANSGDNSAISPFITPLKRHGKQQFNFPTSSEQFQ